LGNPGLRKPTNRSPPPRLIRAPEQTSVASSSRGPGRVPLGDPAGRSRHSGLRGPPAPRHHVPRSQQPSQGPPSQQQHPQSSQVQTPATQQPQQSQSGQGAPLASGVRARAAHKTSPAMKMLLGNVLKNETESGRCRFSSATRHRAHGRAGQAAVPPRQPSHARSTTDPPTSGRASPAAQPRVREVAQ